ncbi:hypothetical protein [Mycobacterium sp.]|uniref:hypothetical protein n=1 Tax=Mycobacterium sp. TaxID=1785 RepID=UPI0031DF174E
MPSSHPIPGSLWLDEQPADERDRLWETDPECAGRVEDALDLIDTEPTSAEATRRKIRRLAGGPLNAVDVRCRDCDLQILWEHEPDGTIVVRYLGEPVL